MERSFPRFVWYERRLHELSIPLHLFPLWGVGKTEREAGIDKAQGVVPLLEIGRVTAPWVPLGLRAQLRLHGIEMDVPASGQEVGIFLDEAAMEATLEEMPHPSVPLVEILRVPRAHTLHHLGDRRARRCLNE